MAAAEIVELTGNLSAETVSRWFAELERTECAARVEVQLDTASAGATCLLDAFAEARGGRLETKVRAVRATTEARSEPLPSRFCPRDRDEARTGSDRIAREAIERVDGVPPSFERLARRLAEELALNAIEHSGVGGSATVAIHFSKDPWHMQVAAADRGRGFRLALRAPAEGLSDAEALQLALAHPWRSTDPTTGRLRVGLKQLVDASDLLSGDLYMASGEALLFRRTIAGQRTTALRTISHWQGSWICLDAPLPSGGVKPPSG
jgi:hypothetical protein